MGYVSKVAVGSHVHPVGSSLYGTCDTAANTVEKAVVCPDFDELATGVTMHIKFTNTNTIAEPTLNVNSTGARAIVRYGTTKVGTTVKTSWPAGAVISFTYDGMSWCMNDFNDDSNTTYSVFSNISTGNGSYVAHSAVYRYQMLFQINANTLTPLNNVSNGYKNMSKAILTNVEFDPFGKIFYYRTTTTVEVNTSIGAGSLTFISSDVDWRYILNVNASTNPLTANQDVYLKVSPQNNGKVKLASATPLTQALPATNDGYWYIYIGRAYSTYQSTLSPHHPVFKHNGTRIVEVSPNTLMPLDSPVLSGIPTAPTAASGTNSTQIATTAFVQDALNGVSGGSSGIPFGVCSTNEGTFIKTVTIDGVTALTNGLRISVYFSNNNGRESSQLNVNSLGAKYIKSDAGYAKFSWRGGEIVDFVYYNNFWYQIDGAAAATYALGKVKLADRIDTSYANQHTLPTPSAIVKSINLATPTYFKMIHDQYYNGIYKDNRVFVLRLYFVDNNGTTYYGNNRTEDSYYYEYIVNILSHVTVTLNGYDSSNYATEICSNDLSSYEPADMASYDDSYYGGAEGGFVCRNGVIEFACELNYDDSIAIYDHLGFVIDISSGTSLTLYNSNQDLAISSSDLSTYNNLIIKNVGLNISPYLINGNGYTNYYFWKSEFDIPNETEVVPQIDISIDDDDYLQNTSGNCIGYGFVTTDIIGEYIWDAGGPERIVDNGVMTLDYKSTSYRSAYRETIPFYGKTFITADGHIYFSDYRLCKEIGVTTPWQGGSF